MILPIQVPSSQNYPVRSCNKKYYVIVYGGSRNSSAIIHSSQYKMPTEIRRNFFPRNDATSCTLLWNGCEIREKRIMNINPLTPNDL
jgi:hypothetical protein